MKCVPSGQVAHSGMSSVRNVSETISSAAPMASPRAVPGARRRSRTA